MQAQAIRLGVSSSPHTMGEAAWCPLVLPSPGTAQSRPFEPLARPWRFRAAPRKRNRRKCKRKQEQVTGRRNGCSRSPEDLKRELERRHVTKEVRSSNGGTSKFDLHLQCKKSVTSDGRLWKQGVACQSMEHNSWLSETNHHNPSCQIASEIEQVMNDTFTMYLSAIRLSASRPQLFGR
jgi:hypothetical protein